MLARSRCATSRLMRLTMSFRKALYRSNTHRQYKYWPHDRSARIALAIYLLWCTPMLTAQQYPLGDDIARPIPGSGHEYIHALAETVSPANGTVNLKLDIPVPKGRGLSMPFALTYNSGSVFHFISGRPGCGGLDNSQCVGESLPDRSYAGWSDTIPYAVFSEADIPLSAPESGTCKVYSSYTLYDSSGVGHALGLGLVSPPLANQGVLRANPDACKRITEVSNIGGDSQVQARSDYCSGDLSTSQSGCYPDSPKFKVTDLAGTVYSFLQSLKIKGFALIFPNIEDRNGNLLTVDGCRNCNPQSLNVTDTVGRPLISFSYNQAVADGYQPASYTIGGLSYTPVYTTTSAHWTASSQQVNPQTDPTVTCTASFNVNETAVQVLQSVTLPNGKQYTFQYDPIWGLLSEVDYPDGGWVRYTWKLSDTLSTLASFDAYNPEGYSPFLAQGACNFQYQTPVVATRKVGFAPGSPAALSQTFTYNTHWTQQNPFAWDVKTTNVVTTDNVTQQTTTAVYQYSPVYQAAQPNVRRTPQIPVESKITYFDGNGTLLQTVNQQWQDEFLQTQQQTVLPNGITTETDTHFASYPSVVQEKDEYTAGTAPSLLRKTTYKYYELGFPNQIITQDGAGNKVAETDLYYDGQTSLATASTAAPVAGVSNAIRHDTDNYGPSSTLPRANATKVVQWENTGSSPTTSYTYDDAGQALSMQDPNGNTTSYSYADKYTSGTPSGNTDAYVTQITRPAVNVPHIENFYYRFEDGQLASATDENLLTTSYTYNDPLNRLTEVDFPDGGQTITNYNDAAPSPSVTTTQLLDSSGTKKSTTVTRDGMGHVLHTQLTSDPAGTDTVDMVYDGHGNIVSTTNPYRSTSDPTYGATTYTYDALERKVGQRNPDGSTLSWCYNSIPSAPTGNGVPKQSCSSGDLSSATGVWMDETDENKITTQRVSDGLSRLIAVMSPDPKSGTALLETDYKYDALNNLTQVAQKGTSGETPRNRSFTYDSLSRLLTSTNPETGKICYGIVSGQGCNGGYDGNGNLVAKTDARGQTTSYLFDALNRLTGKSYSGMTAGVDVTPSACFEYDTDPTQGTLRNPVGRLTAEWTQAGSCPTTNTAGVPSAAISWKKIPSYDAMGRKIQEQQCPLAPCNSDVGTFYWTYDLAGDVKSSTNGSGTSGAFGISIASVFDGAQNLSSLTSTSADNDASHPTTLLMADAAKLSQPYGPFGLQNAQLGLPLNSQTPLMTHMRQYDTRGRLVDDKYLASAVTPSGSQPSSVSHAQVLSVSPNPVASGVSAIAVTACDATCGSGTGQVYVDDSPSVSGFTYSPGDQQQNQLPPQQPGPHTVYVAYQRSSDGATFTSAKTTFTATDTVLPDPQMTVTVDPDPVPQGELGAIHITLTACGTNCGSGVGEVYIDGTFASGFEIDGDGEVITYSSTTLTADTHKMIVYWYGSGSYRASSVSRDLVVAPNHLPLGQISATIDPSTGILDGEYGWIHVSNSCNSACGGGQYFIDGNFAGGFTLDDSGHDLVPIYPGLSKSSHTLTLTYFGDADFKQSESGNIPFNVVDNNLTAPSIALAYPSTPVPASTWSEVIVTLTPPATPANASCQGQGQIIVDGQYSDTFFVQADNTVIGVNGPNPLLRPLGSGTHNGSVNYYGNDSCKQLSQPFTYQAQ